jgi:hypothetical protein
MIFIDFIIAQGCAAIKAYVEDLATWDLSPLPETLRGKKPKTVLLKPALKPSWVQTLVMCFACYLPEVATTSEAVLLEFIHDKYDKYKCLNHHKQQAKDTIRRNTVIGTGNKHAGFVELAGVAHHYCSGTIKELLGHLNCRCFAKDALIKFYLFKTMIGHSTNPCFDHLDFYWEPNTIIPTHVCAFMVSLFRQHTGLNSDSPMLYTGVSHWGSCVGQWVLDDFEDTMKLQAL